MEPLKNLIKKTKNGTFNELDQENKERNGTEP